MFVRGALAACPCGNGYCGYGQYCVEEPVWGSDENNYYCVNCSNGQVPNASCDACISPCTGYDDECPANAGDNVACKVDYSITCPADSGCQNWKRCSLVNGEILSDFMKGECHLEGSENTCYVNELPCSWFGIDSFDVGWNCEREDQVGNAVWSADHNAWDTKNCSCSTVDRDLVAYGGVAAGANCIKANADFYVRDEERYETTSAAGFVYYSIKRKFCRQCSADSLPVTMNSPDAYGIILRPQGMDGNWGVISCGGTAPSGPFVVNECVIDFSLPSGTDAVNACLVPDSTLYTDSIGTFRLGNNWAACADYNP